MDADVHNYPMESWTGRNVGDKDESAIDVMVRCHNGVLVECGQAGCKIPYKCGRGR